MADAPVLGAGKRSVKLSDDAFGARFHGALVHESVRAELNARRKGTASTKTRGLVSGGGAKPWRQKGTGRARAGSNRSPIWTGGGTVFGPHPRSYTFKINRKERRAALRSALSLHAERGSIAIVDPTAFATPATRQAADLLTEWGQQTPTLVVLSANEDNAALSFRNIARISVQEVANIGVADIIGAASLLISEPALEALTARASGSTPAAEASTGEGADDAADTSAEDRSESSVAEADASEEGA
jgi:large subunit ribosomal protein L4